MIKTHFALNVLAASLTSFAIVSRANPLPGPSQVQMCINFPSTQVGNMVPAPITSRDNSLSVDLDDELDPDFTHLLPRATAIKPPKAQVFWCTQGTETFLRINTTAISLGTDTTSSSPASAPSPPSAFATFCQYLQSRIQFQIQTPPTTKLDGVITTAHQAPPSRMSLLLKSPSSPWELNLWNTKKNQVTWGVLASAVTALEGYEKSLQPHFIQNGTLAFDIFDGSNQVGYGNVMTSQ